MNELKKGDRCKYDNFTATVEKVFADNDIEISYRDNDGNLIIEPASMERLTRITTHAERMQKVIDIAFDAENRLQDGEVVQLLVGDLAAFARHYERLRDNILDGMNYTKNQILNAEDAIKHKERLLKGEI